MVSLIYQRSAYLLAAIIFIVFNPGKVYAQTIADQKNIIPTFYGPNILRVHPDELQLTMSGDYTFYKPDDAAHSHFKNDLHTTINKQDSLLMWATTNIPTSINMYLLRGTEQGVMSIINDSPGDSLQADNTTIYQHIFENDPSDVIAAYTFHKKKWYTLIFHTTLIQKGIDDNAQKKQHFVNQTRAIIETLQINVPDIGGSFFSLEPTDKENTYALTVKHIAILEKCFTKNITDSEKDMLLQSLATMYTFVGNQQKAIAYTTIRQPVKTISLKDSSQFIITNAQTYILQQAARQKALFFNESHVDVRTRAFLAGLLPELKKLGYTKLAMEALDTDSITFPTSTNGFYTCEPGYGKLLRSALKNGFQLINYEDTAASSTWNSRDSTQASNIIRQLKASTDKGKLLVLAGHNHIFKYSTNPDFIPMAMYFTRMSGIDPYCIDSDDANHVKYTGIDDTQSYILLRNNVPVNPRPLLYNLQIHYPETLTDATQLPVDLKIYHILPPANSLLLIYDADEYEKAGTINKLVPVYSFYPANTYYNLSLDRKKYIVCLFDNKGQLLSQQKMEVK